ncbi:MAG: 2-hydroxyhepta-2,4-diene-1,7-dioate isomerase, partial [Candidatus Methanoperedens sp.]|nr:2-hydroxyhepta-2,4-diene-1,7-dioate isomerase [Candidatus Methanoperedens sp.]
MIGRFKCGNEIFYGEVKGMRVIVKNDLYCDTFLLSELQLLPPTQPSKIICVGLNYIDHAKE